jgi:hypothetical protein
VSATEQEAYGRWCPMVRVTQIADGTFYTNQGDGAQVGPFLRTMCIGATCMAWRWEMELERGEPHDGTVVAALKIANRVRSNRGYCGLAGKPEVA